MTKDDILSLARDVGAAQPESLYGRTDYVVMTISELERFAALVEKHAIAASMPAIKLAMAEERKNGAREEREACAKLAEQTVCDTHLPTGVKIYGYKAAVAIRARGQA